MCINYFDIIFFNLIIQLFENIGIYKHVINPIKNKYLLYDRIYCLGLLKLEMLKFYIKNTLKTRFIWLLNSPINVLFFLIKNQMAIFSYVLIIKILIIKSQKINILYLLLVTFWISQIILSGLTSLILLLSIIK